MIVQWLLMFATLATAPLWPGHWDGLWSRITAVVLVMIGAGFGISGVFFLRGSRTTFPEPLPKARLIRTGIYGIVRHPLYTSVIVLSLSWALWWRSMPCLVLALASTVFHDAKARHEETRLHLRFPDYQDYARQVKRLIPWIY